MKPNEAAFRQLPAVEEIAVRLQPLESRFPRTLIIHEIRRVLDAIRHEMRSGRPFESAIEARVTQSLEDLAQPSLRRVINATGVVLHTNLGRAPLPSAEQPHGYSNLQYDLTTPRPAHHHSHPPL